LLSVSRVQDYLLYCDARTKRTFPLHPRTLQFYKKRYNPPMFPRIPRGSTPGEVYGTCIKQSKVQASIVQFCLTNCHYTDNVYKQCALLTRRIISKVLNTKDN
jgi:hypothetical protein